MNDKERADRLEETIARMLQPLKGVPFSAVIRGLADLKVLPIEPADKLDAALIEKLTKAAVQVGKDLRAKPILRPRPNEVGNDIEPYVMAAVCNVGLNCKRASAASGGGKTTGYPDLIIEEKGGRRTYVECKIYGKKNKGTTMRSFYLSPSDDFKVAYEARHLLMAFEVTSKVVQGSDKREYTADAFTLLDLHDLLCDVKYEFNSDNKRLYGPGLVLAAGRV